MKPRLLPFLFAFFALAFTAQPLSAADKPEGDKEAKKNTTIVVLTAKPAAIHDAALQALAAIGCEVKKDTADAIEGKRPNKVGLAVGSGGEKLFLTLRDLGDGKTEVKVVTKKTLLGIAGQKLWNEEVAKQISEAAK